MIRTAAIAAMLCAASPALAQQPSLHHPDLPVAGTVNSAQLTTLRKLVDATPGGDPDRPALQLRLANELSKSAASADRDESRALLRELLDKHPKLPRRDDVIYALALAHQEAKDAPAARKLFVELIRNFPSSKHIPGAYCSFGDHFFQQQAHANARRFYEKALQFNQTRIVDYAHYMLGWVHLRDGRHQIALESFFKLHTRARQRPQIASAAQEGLVLAYAAVGKPGKAFAFFTRVDRRAAAAMQHQLAERYAAKSKHHKAIATYRELIARSPKDLRICDWQAGVARSVSKTGSRQAAAREIRRLRAIGRQLKRPLCDELADAI